MQRLWERLEQLSPVIDTARAHELAASPEERRDRYALIAKTFYPLEPVKRIRQNLLRRLESIKCTLGYVAGDYGYGKTATAVWLWHECEKDDFVAVPPFLFYDFDDLLVATTAWLKVRLRERRPDLTDQVEELADRHRQKSSDELARDIAERQRIPLEKARRIVEEEILPRSAVMTAPHIADFLWEAAQTARQAGFKGLIVFADELQDYVDQGDPRERVEDLRRFVHAFRALPDVAVGVFFTMPSRIEERLHEQAGDAVQRTQEHQVYLSLQDAYGSDFPRELWEHLCQRYAPEAKGAVDEATLEALGQIAVRKDLSNGPRTVISAFRCIATHYQRHRKPYTPWELMDDYQHGQIVFEGQGHLITTTMQRLMDVPPARDNPELQKAVRILCAFPEGVHRSVLEHYEVLQAVEYLAESGGWLGTHIIEPMHRYFALRELQAHPGAEDIVKALLGRFRDKWLHETSEGERLAAAKMVFATYLLPELFPKRGQGEQSKWSYPRERGWEQEEIANCSLEGSFEGTQSRFPNRKISVAVVANEEALSRFQLSGDDVDVDFRFALLALGEAAGQIVTTRGDRRVDFRLNLEQHFGEEYPSDIALLRDILLPHHCSAKALLNLVLFVQAELERRDLADHIRLSLEQNLMRPAVRYIIQLLFNADIQQIGISLKGAGRELMERVFETKCADLYPDYESLITSRQSVNDLERYRRALSQGGLPLRAKRGEMPVRLTREELAQKLGLSGTSQLDTLRDRLKAMKLLASKEVRLPDERCFEATFTEHPLERQMRQWVRERGENVKVQKGGKTHTVKRWRYNDLLKEVRRHGYTHEEVEQLLDIATLRGRLERDGEFVREAIIVDDVNAIRSDAEQLCQRLKTLQPFFTQRVVEFLRQLEEVVAKTCGDDEAEWDEARIALGNLEVQVKEFVRNQAEQIARDLEQLSRQLHNFDARLPLRELEQPFKEAIRLSEFVDDWRRRMQRDFQRLRRDLEQAADKAEKLKSHAKAADTETKLAEVAEAKGELEQHAEQLRRQVELERAYLEGWQAWKALTTRAANLRASIPDRYGDLRNGLEQWMEAAMEHFAQRQKELLKTHEVFERQLQVLEAQRAKLEQDERDAFYGLVDQFKQEMVVISTGNINATRFDSADPDGSYDALFSTVLSAVSESLDKLAEIFQQSQAQVLFLQEMRRLDVSEELAKLRQLNEARTQLAQLAHREVIAAFREGDVRFKQLCENIRKWLDEASELRQRLAKRDEKQPLESEEQAFMNSLHEVLKKQGGGRVNLVQLWQVATQNSGVPAEQIFALLDRLYRKGWLDVELIERQR